MLKPLVVLDLLDFFLGRDLSHLLLAIFLSLSIDCADVLDDLGDRGVALGERDHFISVCQTKDSILPCHGNHTALLGLGIEFEVASWLNYSL